MKFLLVLALAVVACTAVSVQQKGDAEAINALELLTESEDDIDLLAEDNDDGIEISPHNIIFRWQLNRFWRKFQKKMKCGFPKYGIGSLAPLRIEDEELNFELGPFKTENSIHHLRVDGLDKSRFEKFQINLIFKRIKFRICFKNIKASSPKFSTNTILDALKSHGLNIQVQAEDTFYFGLKNVCLEGVLYYDTPILWGSNKIKSLKTELTIGEVHSEVHGILGNGKGNDLVNAVIEQVVQYLIKENTNEMSDMIENAIVPRVNKQLKGTDFWDIIQLILNAIDGEKEDDPIVVKCTPPPDPWA